MHAMQGVTQRRGSAVRRTRGTLPEAAAACSSERPSSSARPIRRCEHAQQSVTLGTSSQMSQISTHRCEDDLKCNSDALSQQAWGTLPFSTPTAVFTCRSPGSMVLMNSKFPVRQASAVRSIAARRAQLTLLTCASSALSMVCKTFATRAVCTARAAAAGECVREGLSSRGAFSTRPLRQEISTVSSATGLCAISAGQSRLTLRRGKLVDRNVSCGRDAIFLGKLTCRR